MDDYLHIAKKNLRSLISAAIVVWLMFSLYWILNQQLIFGSIWLVVCFLWFAQLIAYDRTSLRFNTNFFLVCGMLAVLLGAVLKPKLEIEWWLCSVPVFTSLFFKQAKDIIFHSIFVMVAMVLIPILGKNDISMASMFPRITLPIFQAIFSYFHFNRSLDRFEKTEQLIRDKFELKEKLIKEEARTATIIADTAQKIAHDIRSPFSMVKTIIHRLKDGKISYKDLERFDQSIAANFNFVESLIQDLLLSTKDNAAKFEISDLRQVIAEIESLLVLPSTFDYSISLNHSNKVNINSHKIQRVLLNLVNNAREHMQPSVKGKIWIETKNVDRERVSNVQIIVGNSGTYIPPSEIDLIFKKYHSKNQKSTGIGLAICSEVIKEHDGQISCISDEKGTEFIIELPSV